LYGAPATVYCDSVTLIFASIIIIIIIISDGRTEQHIVIGFGNLALVD